MNVQTGSPSDYLEVIGFFGGSPSLGWAVTSSRAVLVFGCAVACLATGCTKARVRDAFSTEFKCREERVEVEELPEGRYRAIGCDRRIVYQCAGKRCIPDNATLEKPASEPEPTKAPAP
jgi:hypothetical protein